MNRQFQVFNTLLVIILYYLWKFLFVYLKDNGIIFKLKKRTTWLQEQIKAIFFCLLINRFFSVVEMRIREEKNNNKFLAYLRGKTRKQQHKSTGRKKPQYKRC